LQESGVHGCGPNQELARTLQSVGEGGKDESRVLDELSVEVDHSKKSLKSRFICRHRKLRDDSGVLDQGATAGAAEAMTQKLNLRDRELTLGKADGEAMETAELKNLS